MDRVRLSGASVHSHLRKTRKQGSTSSELGDWFFRAWLNHVLETPLPCCIDVKPTNKEVKKLYG